MKLTLFLHLKLKSFPREIKMLVEKSFHDGYNMYMNVSISHSFSLLMERIQFYWTKTHIQCVTLAVAVVLGQQGNIFSLPISKSSSFDWKKGRHLLEKKKVDFEMVHHRIFYYVVDIYVMYAKIKRQIFTHTHILHTYAGYAEWRCVLFSLHSYCMFKHQNHYQQYTDC